MRVLSQLRQLGRVQSLFRRSGPKRTVGLVGPDSGEAEQVVRGLARCHNDDGVSVLLVDPVDIPSDDVSIHDAVFLGPDADRRRKQWWRLYVTHTAPCTGGEWTFELDTLIVCWPYRLWFSESEEEGEKFRFVASQIAASASVRGRLRRCAIVVTGVPEDAGLRHESQTELRPSDVAGFRQRLRDELARSHQQCGVPLADPAWRSTMERLLRSEEFCTLVENLQKTTRRVTPIYFTARDGGSTSAYHRLLGAITSSKRRQTGSVAKAALWTGAASLVVSSLLALVVAQLPRDLIGVAQLVPEAATAHSLDPLIVDTESMGQTLSDLGVLEQLLGTKSTRRGVEEAGRALRDRQHHLEMMEFAQEQWRCIALTIDDPPAPLALEERRAAADDLRDGLMRAEALGEIYAGLGDEDRGDLVETELAARIALVLASAEPREGGWEGFRRSREQELLFAPLFASADWDTASSLLDGVFLETNGVGFCTALLAVPNIEGLSPVVSAAFSRVSPWLPQVDWERFLTTEDPSALQGMASLVASGGALPEPLGPTEMVAAKARELRAPRTFRVVIQRLGVEDDRWHVGVKSGGTLRSVRPVSGACTLTYIRNTAGAQVGIRVNTETERCVYQDPRDGCLGSRRVTLVLEPGTHRFRVNGLEFTYRVEVDGAA